jgi:putative hydrolase of the HAD superfamily
MIKIEAVIFDYGNVLCEPQLVSDVQAMASVCDLELSTMQSLYWRFRDPYDKGHLDANQYWSEIAKAAAKQFSPLQIEKARLLDNLSWTRPSQPMIAWVKHLRSSGLRTAILSNMPLALREYIDANCDWLPEFDESVFSCDAGHIKPQPEIYHHCLERLGVKPEHSLFIDDRQPNISAAESLGMHGITFVELGHALDEAQERFNLPVQASHSHRP